ncbi:ABC transporter ATP-binding protein [Streptomyces sp. NBC_00259]
MTTTRQTPVQDAVELHGVRKVHGTGGHRVTALDGVSLGFPRGTFTAIMGPSGSGKSTLLQCGAGLEQPTDGRVVLAGVDIGRQSEKERTQLRRDHVGFVFQAFNLVESLTAAQNVELPSRFAGRKVSRDQVRNALAAVGLAERAGHRPSQLSGGQQQRVALAQALVTRSDVLFADEPTGALDTATSREVLRTMRMPVIGLFVEPGLRSRAQCCPFGFGQQYAELVALRVGENDPAPAVGLAAIGDQGGAQLQQPLNLCVP